MTSFAFDPRRGTAFYTSDNTAFRDLMAVDVRTGESRMLLEDARVGNIAFNPADRSLLGVRHAAGQAVLVHIPYPYTEWKALHLFPYGVVAYDLDVSPDGKLPVGLGRRAQRRSVPARVGPWPVLARRPEPVSEFRFGQSVPESFVFSKDGRYLYGSSYYTGVSNIFRYEVATGHVEAVSNTDATSSARFRSATGVCWCSSTRPGFVPAVIDPVVVKDASAIRFLGTELARSIRSSTKWQVDSPAAVDDEKLIADRGTYRPLANLALNNAFPVLQGYKDARRDRLPVQLCRPHGPRRPSASRWR